ncbi:cache domain-containing protein [Hahella sp. SMD15-11]|uniref:Cache domain-containing protein n=1 Tax=Thermohahella caldifontis TaxID=3142973 RepID=A0AB39UU89_9GAMM
MTLRTKVILLAVAPLMLVTLAFAVAMINLGDRLAERELKTFETNLLRSREAALRDYVSMMGITAAFLRDQSRTDQEAQALVRALLQRMKYSDDGYFFAYTPDGVNLVHAVQPELVGQNLYDFQDTNGDFLIQNLLAKARDGGGVHRYLWRRPSTGAEVDKISYVEALPDWEWMFGTGLYVDDIQAEMVHIREDVNANVKSALLRFSSIGLGAVMVVLLAAIGVNVHEHRLADASLKRLAQKTVQLQEEERRRVSRELHDGINQWLVAVKYRLESALHLLGDTDSPVRRQIREAEVTLQQSIQEARRISHALRPRMLDELGLEAAVAHQLDEFRKRTGVEVVQNLRIDERRVPESLATTLFRIIQEALTNIEKHAGAANVILRLEQDAEGLYLQIRDDGCGFKTRQLSRAEGIGVKNMRERVEFFGGDFYIRSDTDKGTAIHVYFSEEQLQKRVG